MQVSHFRRGFMMEGNAALEDKIDVGGNGNGCTRKYLHEIR